MSTQLERALELRALIVRAVEEKGADYVYERPDLGYDPVTESKYELGNTCRYTQYDEEAPHHLAPSCLFGHVAHYRDPENGLVEAYDYEGQSAADMVNDLLGLDFRDDPIAQAAQCAQGIQDGGHPWGAALREFDKHLAAFVPGYEEAIR